MAGWEPIQAARIWLIFASRGRNDAAAGSSSVLSHKRGKHLRQRFGTRCDGKSRHLDTFDDGAPARPGRQPLGVRRRQIDNKADHGGGLVGQVADAETAHLDQPGKLGHWANQQTAMMSLQDAAVVRHQAGKGWAPAFCRPQQREREPRFAGARGAADQQGAGADEHRRGVNGRHRGQRPKCGKAAVTRLIASRFTWPAGAR